MACLRSANGWDTELDDFIVVSSGSQKLAARWDVAFSSDGLDQFGVEAALAPSAGGDVEKIVVILVGPVGPAVAAKVMPAE